jgi:hypothetical protein
MRDAVSRDPANVEAFLWMSKLVADPLKREACLQRILCLCPGHQLARQDLATARRDATAHLLNKGIAATRSGDDARARKILLDVVTRDELNVQAWRWLSSVVETP